MNKQSDGRRNIEQKLLRVLAVFYPHWSLYVAREIKRGFSYGEANCLSVSIGLCENANASVSINELNSIEFDAQPQSRYKFQSFTDCVRYTYKTERVHGFWRGGFIVLRCLRTFANSFTQASGHPWRALRWSGRYPFPSTRNRNTPTMIGFTRPLAAPP